MGFHSVKLEFINVHMWCLIGVPGEISIADVATFKGVGDAASDLWWAWLPGI